MARDIKGRLQRWRKVIKSIRQNEELFAAMDMDCVGEAAKTAMAGETLAKAFKELGLEAGKPYHTELVCAALADVIFGRSKVGRKLGRVSAGTWNSARLFVLARDYQKLLESNPNISDAKAAKQLAGRGATVEQVRRQLPKAREHLVQAMQYLQIADAELTSQ
jgi:hypothetical protein